MTRAPAWSWAAFAPFVVVSVVQLVTKVTDDVALDHLTKALCVPLLAAGAVVVLVAARRRMPPVPVALLAIGLLASTLGDVFVETSVPAGLGFFLAAHVAYIAILVIALRPRPSWWLLIGAPWYAVLIVLLLPYLHALLVPVLVYGAALGTMAALATRGGTLLTLGGMLFVASDTALALQLFTPYLRGDLVDLFVMSTYLAAQCLLVLGMLIRLDTWPTPSSNESAPDTSRTRRSRASRSPG